jgi:transcriptional regulator with XRE-family HTH domain
MPSITLAAARVNKKLTQKELAKMMGVSNYTIVNWERGKTSPNGKQLKRLSEIFDLSIDYIFLN